MNANGMIDTAADYAFVDFANGDLPTANIDGHPMPLRTGSDVGLLMAEDVAFLHEGVADKGNAFLGTEVFVDGARYNRKSDLGEPPVRTLTKRLSGAQMDTTRGWLADLLGRGCASRSRTGFLGTPVFQWTTIYRGDDRPDRNIDYGVQQVDGYFGGRWQSRAVQSDFIGDGDHPAKVRREPLMYMFEDLKHLYSPCCWLTWAGLGTMTWEFTVKGGNEHSSTYPSNPVNILWYQYRRGGDNDVCGSGAPAGSVAVASVPCDFVDPASLHLWGLLYLHNSYTSGTGQVFNLSRIGLFDLGPYVTDAFSDGKKLFAMSKLQAGAFCDAVVAATGWTKYTLDSAVYFQQIEIAGFEVLFTATPNGRTKWWSD